MWFLFRCWKLVYFREIKYWFKTFFKFNWCFGECFPLIFYNSLICICYIIVHAHKQIHHCFFWRKSAQDTGSFDSYGNSVQKKEVNQSGDIYFIENIPKTQQKCCPCFTLWIFLKSTPLVFNWKNLLLFMVHSRLQT